MKSIIVSYETEGRIGFRYIPLDKIVSVDTYKGSEERFCVVNGLRVRESYTDILRQIDYWD